MSNNINLRESDLVAILQQHYRRFVASVEFVEADGETVIDVLFDDGGRYRISKGNHNENKGKFLSLTAAMAN